MQETNFFTRYGFLVARFRRNFYLMEVGIMMRKLGVAIAGALFGHSMLRANVACGWLVACWAHLCFTTPYVDKVGSLLACLFALRRNGATRATQWHNRFAVICLAFSCLVLWSGTIRSERVRDIFVIVGLFVQLFVLTVGATFDTMRLTRLAKRLEGV